MEDDKKRPRGGPALRFGYVLRGPAHTSSATWRPLADVYKCEEGWMVKLELAGVLPEDIQIFANSRKLTVSGVRRDTVTEQGSSHYLMEISYNRFERTIELPVDFEAKHLFVDYRNGILLVRVNINVGNE